MGSSDMRGWLWLLFCLCVIKRNTADVMTFSKYDYPNPWTNSTACGRPGPSNVCDPGRYLNAAEVDHLDDIITSIEELKDCPCDYCDRDTDPYVRVQIAIVPSIAGNFSSTSEKANATKDFAHHLQDSRGRSSRGNCRNGVFVVLAIVQRQVYTVSGPDAKNEGLEYQRIQDIFDANADLFTQKDYGAGLAALLEGYRRVLNEGSGGLTSQQMVWTFFGVGFVIIMSVVGVAYCYPRHCRRSRGGGSGRRANVSTISGGGGGGWGGGGGGGGGGAGGGGFGGGGGEGGGGF